MTVELKSKYFCEDGTWFETRKEAEDYEERQVPIDWVGGHSEVIDRLLERFTIKERYNWKPPEEPKDETPD